MSILGSLREMGLNDAEVDIYKVLLGIGASPASMVAKQTGIKRTTTYSILQNLKEKGFVGGYYKNDCQFFYAERPERVANRYENRLQSFMKIIPELVKNGVRQEEIEGVHPIATVAELKNFYRDMLEEYKRKSYSIIGNSQNWEALDPEFFVQFRKDRARNTITTRLLLDTRSVGINPKDSKLLRTWKYLPPGYAFDGVIDIFDNKVLIISTELRSLAVIIGIPAMVGMFKVLFQILWDMLPEEKNIN
ncbi:MAG: helix-turn-helix domain-containing protein [Patescibacteria group bacterium]